MVKEEGVAPVLTIGSIALPQQGQLRLAWRSQIDATIVSTIYLLTPSLYLRSFLHYDTLITHFHKTHSLEHRRLITHHDAILRTDLRPAGGRHFRANPAQLHQRA